MAALCDETTPIFKKKAFGSFELAQYLHDGGFTHIELIGVAAHICVFCNAILAAAAQTEAEIKVDSSCVASASEHQKQVALEVLSDLQIIVS